MNGFGRNILFWIAILLTLAFLFNIFNTAQQKTAGKGDSIAYSDFMQAVQDGSVAEITIKGQQIRGQYAQSGDNFTTLVPENENVVERIDDAPVRINAEETNDGEMSLFGILVSWFPMLLLIGVWIFFMRQMQGKSGGGAMGFGKSRARMLTDI